MRIIKRTPPRVSQIFADYNPPLYFLTMNTWQRAKCLNNLGILEALRLYAEKNIPQGRAIGRFVVMPDHIHLFARLSTDSKLSDFVRILKQSLSAVLKGQGLESPWWQPGFFDHILRHDESYSEKWDYVRQNPVRAGLVKTPDEWPYQGEIARIDRV